MKPSMREALNEQMNKELYSGYLYLSMSAYFESEALLGFAQWMKDHAQEEVDHAMKIFHFMNERGQRVTLGAIDQPETEFASPLSVFEMALAHEKMVTGLINDLYELALSEKDHATAVFLQWFITEQVEEEATFGDILDQLKRAGTSEHALFMLDRHLISA